MCDPRPILTQHSTIYNLHPYLLKPWRGGVSAYVCEWERVQQFRAKWHNLLKLLQHLCVLQLYYPLGVAWVWLWTQTQPLRERSGGYPSRVQRSSTGGYDSAGVMSHWLCMMQEGEDHLTTGRVEAITADFVGWVYFPEPGYPRVYSLLVCAFKFTYKPPAYIINYFQPSLFLDSKNQLKGS